MAEVFWFKVRNPQTGRMEVYPKKGAEDAIARMGGEKVWGSVEEVDDDELDDDGLYEQPHGRLADLSPQNRALVEAVTQLAQARGCTPAQLALAWLLDQGEDIVPIPGTRRIARVDENAQAAFLHLTADERRRLEDVLAAHPVAGTRYPQAQMARVNA